VKYQPFLGYPSKRLELDLPVTPSSDRKVKILFFFRRKFETDFRGFSTFPFPFYNILKFRILNFLSGDEHWS
jgi:hypothetical protein